MQSLLPSLYEKGFRYFRLSGGGAFAKLVLQELLELQQLHPDVKITLYAPSLPFRKLKKRFPDRYEYRRSKGGESLPLLLMTRSRAAFFFDVTPGCYYYYSRLEETTKCFCMNLAEEDYHARYDEYREEG